MVAIVADDIFNFVFQSICNHPVYVGYHDITSHNCDQIGS